jgi:hypothetical protein
LSILEYDNEKLKSIFSVSYGMETGGIVIVYNVNSTGKTQSDIRKKNKQLLSLSVCAILITKYKNHILTPLLQLVVM